MDAKFKLTVSLHPMLRRIPHPMWSYQPRPTSFSDETWACHLGCGRQTRWRLGNPTLIGAAGERIVERIGWGPRGFWLSAIRRQRRQEVRDRADAVRQREAKHLTRGSLAGMVVVLVSWWAVGSDVTGWSSPCAAGLMLLAFVINVWASRTARSRALQTNNELQRVLEDAG